MGAWRGGLRWPAPRVLNNRTRMMETKSHPKSWSATGRNCGGWKSLAKGVATCRTFVRGVP
eukprot:6654861-Lingulodinium_polyedra.AAC.1